MRRVLVLFFALLCALPAQAATRATAPGAGLAWAVVDGCPPGYARDLMADCRPMRPQSGYGLPTAPPGYGYAQPPHHPHPVAPQRTVITCPRGYHFSRDGTTCWPNR